MLSALMSVMLCAIKSKVMYLRKLKEEGYTTLQFAVLNSMNDNKSFTTSANNCVLMKSWSRVKQVSTTIQCLSPTGSFFESDSHGQDHSRAEGKEQRKRGEELPSPQLRNCHVISFSWKEEGHPRMMSPTGIWTVSWTWHLLSVLNCIISENKHISV